MPYDLFYLSTILILSIRCTLLWVTRLGTPWIASTCNDIGEEQRADRKFKALLRKDFLCLSLKINRPSFDFQGLLLHIRAVALQRIFENLTPLR